MNKEEEQKKFFDKWDKPHRKLYMRVTKGKRAPYGVFCCAEVFDYMWSRILKANETGHINGYTGGYRDGRAEKDLPEFNHEDKTDE